VTNDTILKMFGAKYVFCLMDDVFGGSAFIPKYTVGWTDMEIEAAPESAVVPFVFLNGAIIVQANVKLTALKKILAIT
jgi:hypothetical protein